MDSIEDKVREVVDEDVPVSSQNTDLTQNFSAAFSCFCNVLFLIIYTCIPALITCGQTCSLFRRAISEQFCFVIY